MIDVEPKEQVGGTTDVVSEDIVSLLQTTDEHLHPLPPKVTFDSLHTNDDVIEPVPIIMPTRYELPPRSTRGIPPKRYDLDFEAQRSIYLINKDNNEGLSQTSMAFNTSQYSSDIPKSVEEALRDSR